MTDRTDRQLDLLTHRLEERIAETLPRSMETKERVRLSLQCKKILALLERGPITNTALSEIALKYTGRISDLRAAGYEIECKRVGSEGVTIYTLVPAHAAR